MYLSMYLYVPIHFIYTHIDYSRAQKHFAANGMYLEMHKNAPIDNKTLLLLTIYTHFKERY